MGREDGAGPGKPTAGSLSDRAAGWLRLQLWYGAAGAIIWYAGVFFGSEFVSGLGVGILVAALALRFVRKGARGEEAAGPE